MIANFLAVQGRNRNMLNKGQLPKKEIVCKNVYHLTLGTVLNVSQLSDTIEQCCGYETILLARSGHYSPGLYNLDLTTDVLIRIQLDILFVSVHTFKTC